MEEIIMWLFLIIAFCAVLLIGGLVTDYLEDK